MKKYDFTDNPAPTFSAEETANEERIAAEILAMYLAEAQDDEKHAAVHCRQCGYWLGDPYFLAEHCPGDKPQEWGYAPENVDWFCPSHALDLGMAELAAQDEAIWIGK